MTVSKNIHSPQSTVDGPQEAGSTVLFDINCRQLTGPWTVDRGLFPNSELKAPAMPR